MEKAAIQRQNKLLELAQQDEIYCVWEKSFENCREAFIQFAANQPEEIRNMLFGYADCGRIAQQRMVNLACEHMIFPEEK